MKINNIYFAFHSVFTIFATMNKEMIHSAMTCENIIIVDADHVDSVTFDLIVNFERMIGRKIANADLAHWIDCVALDGGVREGTGQTQVALIHSKSNCQMENFAPNLFNELNGKAFKDHLGEFVINTYTDEDIVSKEDLFADMLRLCCAAKDVKRIMAIPDERYYDTIRRTMSRVDDDSKRVTVFAMQPMPGGNFRQEILGYSLMSALGIKAEELN